MSRGTPARTRHASRERDAAPRARAFEAPHCRRAVLAIGTKAQIRLEDLLAGHDGPQRLEGDARPVDDARDVGHAAVVDELPRRGGGSERCGISDFQRLRECEQGLSPS